jgi:hypothetical protein
MKLPSTLLPLADTRTPSATLPAMKFDGNDPPTTLPVPPATSTPTKFGISRRPFELSPIALPSTRFELAESLMRTPPPDSTPLPEITFRSAGVDPPTSLSAEASPTKTPQSFSPSDSMPLESVPM